MAEVQVFLSVEPLRFNKLFSVAGLLFTLGKKVACGPLGILGIESLTNKSELMNCPTDGA